MPGESDSDNLITVRLAGQHEYMPDQDNVQAAEQEETITILRSTIESLQLTIETLKETITGNNTTIANLQSTVSSLRATITENNATIVNLKETISELTRKLFGKSSEQTHPMQESRGQGPEEKAETGKPDVSVREHTRKAGKKTLRKDLYASLPVKEVPINAEGKDRICPDCGSEMEHLCYEFVREELRVIPAKVYRARIMREKLVCPVCREEMDTTITEGPVPKPLLAHSPASQSIVAYVMYEKSCMYLPFYRQELDWKEHCVPVPRETQANWYNLCALKYLQPVYDFLHDRLLEREVIHADEVPCQVLHEEDKEPESRSYFWIYLSGTDGLPGIVLYQYCAGRGSSYPAEFLKGFKGMIHCDGYSAYGRIRDVILICCLAHARRKFFDAIPESERKHFRLLDIHSEEDMEDPDITEKAAGKLLPAERGVICCNRIFYKERLYKDLDAEERKKRRLETEPQIWKEFWSWLETLNPAGGSKLEKAVNYAQNHRETLMNYLKDGRCEVSNNAAERRAKSYATGRKNFLFHDTEDGAKASAIVLSLIETAKANSLNVYQYLYTLLLYMPDYLGNPEGIEQLMPWSDFIKKHCSGIADVETNTIEHRDPLPIKKNL